MIRLILACSTLVLTLNGSVPEAQLDPREAADKLRLARPQECPAALWESFVMELMGSLDTGLSLPVFPAKTEQGVAWKCLGPVVTAHGKIEAVPELKSYSYHLYGSAVWIVAKSGDRTAVPGLVKELSGEDVSLVGAAARGLGYLKDRRAVEPLLQMIRSEDAIGVTAAFALGELGDRSVLPALRSALRTAKWIGLRRELENSIERLEGRQPAKPQETVPREPFLAPSPS